MTEFLLGTWNGLPAWSQGALLDLAKILAIVLPLILAVAYLTFAERKVIGYIQARIGPNRVGPRGWLQPLADALKLILKEIIVPANANKFLFVIAPLLAFAPALVAWAVIPFTDTMWVTNIDAGLLFILALSSLGVYGVIVAGWASNSKYAFLGAMRSAAQIVAYEIAMGASTCARSCCTSRADCTSGTCCRCCRCSWCISSPAWPRPTARRSTSPRASPRSWPASTSSIRA